MIRIFTAKRLLCIFSIVSVVAITGCSSSALSYAQRTASTLNRTLEKEQLPIRYQAQENERGGAIASTEWAGTPGKSISLLSSLLNDDIHAAIEKQCGHNRASLKETRLVSQKKPVFYEVWVFHDEESKRNDRLSGLSIIMEQLPNNGGVNFNIKGQCHSNGGASFSFQ